MKHIRSIKNQLICDIQEGILRKWYMLLPIVFLVVITCYSFSRYFYVCTGRMPNYIEQVTYLFSGIQDIKLLKDKISFPIIWMLINLYLAYLIANYSTDDLAGFGKNILIRSGSRTEWICSKFIWSIVYTVFYYIIIFGTLALFCSVRGGFGDEFNAEYISSFFNDAPISVSNINNILISAIIIIPLVSVTFSLCQVMLEFLLTPIFAFFTLLIYNVISFYIYSPFLLGNFTMLLRNECLVSNGFILSEIIPTCLIAALLAVIIGILVFKKYDILEKE